MTWLSRGNHLLLVATDFASTASSLQQKQVPGHGLYAEAGGGGWGEIETSYDVF